MAWTEIAFWSCLMLAGFFGSALCSGMETGSYAINRVRLQMAVHRKARYARALRDELDQMPRVLSTLLVGNNLANYLGTASMTMLLGALQLNDWQLVILNTVLITPLLLIFGETLPKDLFLAHANGLMRRLTPVLMGMRKLLTFVGLVPVIYLFSKVVLAMFGQKLNPIDWHPRSRMERLVLEGAGYGLMSDHQTQMVQRVLDLEQRQLKDIMIPWQRVIVARTTDHSIRFQALIDMAGVSRVPYKDEQGKVLGILNLMAMLRQQAFETEDPQAYLDPVIYLSPQEPVYEALTKMRNAKVRQAVVAEQPEQPLGLVTVKDLLEPITGEISL